MMKIERRYFVGFNKDEEIRYQSTSGGIFYLLAQKILEQGGIVYGVSFDEKYHVRHIEVSKKSELSKIMGSKYVQSYKGNIFKDVEKSLKSGFITLFSGTPCEVLGLQKYLGRDYEKLILVDLFCHGVPSPLIWEKKLAEFHTEKFEKVSFRSKETGWYKSSLRIETLNKKYSCIGEKDPYIILFNHGFSIRPSCFNCTIKGFDRLSDITLGDFWGVKELRPELFDDLGISLLFCSSSKGLGLINAVEDSLNIEEITYDELIYNNGDLGKAIKPPRGRRTFFTDFIKGEALVNLSKKYVKTNYFEKAVMILKLIMKKLGIFNNLKKWYRKVKRNK